MSTFMGIPFEHDGINQGSRGSVEQWGMDKFQEMVQPILDAGVAIRWDQYTPYFNDGDICEFSVGSARFRPNYVESEEDDYEDEGDYGDGFYDLWDVQLKGGEEEVYKGQVQDGYEEWGPRRYAKYRSVYEKTGRVFERHPAYDAMDAMNMSHFEELLYKTFGDHATITMTKDKVIKETYEHE